VALTVARHASERYRWEMVTRPAPPGLAPYVRSYTGYEEWSAAPLRRLEVPGAEVTLILSPDSELRVADARGPQPGGPFVSFVAGLSDSYALVETPGSQYGIEVRLTPIGARALLGMPMHELTNQVVPLDELLGRARGELADRIWDADSWQRRFELLDAAIAARLAEARPPSTEVAWALGRLRASAGRAAIANLPRELGWSHRRLIAAFRDQVGLPPKTLARILRFERVSALLRETPSPRLAEVAFDSGYYDQAHLNRDFREFAGTTPGDYLAHRLPEGGGVAAT
jgi:AraC-like DNA-binding protein